MRAPVVSVKVRYAILILLAGVSLTTRSGEQTFKVCADPNNPPLSVKDGSGYENKIAEAIAKDFDQKLDYYWFPQRLGFIRNTLKAKVEEDSKDYKCDVVMGVPTGFEMAATTQPYYRSTYVMVIRKGGLLDAVKAPADLDKLPAEAKVKLRIAMFDGAPGTTWLLNHHLLGQGIPYQSMTGDVNTNTGKILAQDFADGKLDMVIIWGPIAGYLARQQPGAFELIPMQSEPGLRFDFPISMGVRFPDKERKEKFDAWIAHNGDRIEAILGEYQVPLVKPTNSPKADKDDD